jgi:hypothetical protein
MDLGLFVQSRFVFSTGFFEKEKGVHNPFSSRGMVICKWMFDRFVAAPILFF